MTYITGSYSATFKPAGGSAVDIGKTEDGFEVIESHVQDDILTDDFGKTRVDTVNMGGSTQVRLTWVEYAKIKPAIYAANPQGAPKTNVGKLGTTLAGELVLTPTAGTTAAADGGTWTFKYATVSGDVTILLSSRHRKGPITFDCLPDPSTNLTYVVAAGA